MIIPDFHPLVLHYPIVLMTAVFAFDIAAYFTKRDCKKFALWALVFAIAFLVPTMITGLLAEDFYSPENKILNNHRNLAFVTLGFSVLHLLVRVLMLKKVLVAKKMQLLFLSAINFGLVTVTAHFGGKLVFGGVPW